MTSSVPEGTASVPEPAAPTARESRRADLGRLRLADLVVAAGTLVYLVCLALPWFSIDGFDLGSGYEVPGVSVNGFDSGALIVALALLLLASAWALLPAVADVAVPFPRPTLTAGLAALAFLLTLVEWLATVDTGFTLAGLLAFLSSAVVLAAAVLRSVPELTGSGTVPGRLSGAVRWADRPVRQGPPSVAPQAADPGRRPDVPPHGQQPPAPGGPPPVEPPGRGGPGA